MRAVGTFHPQNASQLAYQTGRNHSGLHRGNIFFILDFDEDGQANKAKQSNIKDNLIFAEQERY